MAERKYFDGGGRVCSLDTLCKREPEWAANRIRVADRQVRIIVDSWERWTRRDLTEEEFAGTIAEAAYQLGLRGKEQGEHG